MKRFLKILKRIFQFLLILIILFVIGLYLFDYDYVIRGARIVYATGHNSAFIDDYTYFENDTIQMGNNPQPWPMHKNYNTIEATDRLKGTNKALGTVAFVIIKNDSIWFEDYNDDFGISSISNSFSMAKSVTSAMMGKAILDGYIKSLDQPVGDFFPQYAEGLAAKMTVGDLSSMASGLDWVEHYTSPFSVTARAYYDDDLAETILNQKVVLEPGQRVRYKSGSTQLLGMVIEKATGKKMAEYLSESFWKPMGMEKDGLWQVDDEDNRLAKTYCCIGSNARDFARFGKLYKDFGQWNGKQLLDSAFVAKSIKPRFEEDDDYGYGFWLLKHQGKDVFYMRGILGQYVMVVPDDNVIVVRLGHQRARVNIKGERIQDTDLYLQEAYKMMGL
ncbi:serine hydrolase [Spongiivirga sp. MCCC 1A20706]|uniref:serine hydrolase domain-containing protein n=1 Tax=Spongiivirga sp. MCCC 1A20706 TaxID=3160963 RepID=UPI00397799E0